jgi:hypothetical protein
MIRRVTMIVVVRDKMIGVVATPTADLRHLEPMVVISSDFVSMVVDHEETLEMEGVFGRWFVRTNNNRGTLIVIPEIEVVTRHKFKR